MCVSLETSAQNCCFVIVRFFLLCKVLMALFSFNQVSVKTLVLFLKVLMSNQISICYDIKCFTMQLILLLLGD